MKLSLRATLPLLVLVLGASTLAQSKKSIRDLFEHVLAKHLHIKPHFLLHQVFPLAKKIPLEKLHLCYDMTVGTDKKINIFNSTILSVTRKYFIEHNDVLDNVNAQKRIKNFVDNLEHLVKLVHNCIHKPKENQTQYGLTSMSAYSYDEYSKQILNHDLEKNLTNPLHTGLTGVYGTDCDYRVGRMRIPDYLNWADLGYVSSIKNQGSCGSCYIFSAVATMESAYMLANRGKNIDLSEQAILNCIPNGCRGGWMDWVWDYNIEKGATYEYNEPYVGREKQCRKYQDGIRLATYCMMNNYNADENIQAIVYKYGPSVAALDASNRDMLSLRGVYNGQCSTTLNHAVVIVGWTPEHWIIKNSWGASWGNKGFLYLPRNQNKCGINTIMGVPYIAK